eukprot:gene8452-9318_t
MEAEDLVVLQSPYWLSGCKESMAWDSSCFAAEIRLRADVKEEAVLGLVDQVLLSLGGQLRRSARQLRAEDGTEGNALPETALAPPQVVVTSSSSCCCWQEVKALLGANLSFQRVLLVLVTAASPSGGLFSLTGSSSSSTTFAAFCEVTASTLLRALTSSSYTCSSSSSHHCSEVAEGVLDLAYLVDLVPVAARLMDEEAQEEARRVDLALRREDLRVARLMTLLRPFYQRACLTLPDPPSHRALASYPLDLPRPSLRIARGTDALRLLLLQARKSYRDHLRSQTAANHLEDCSTQSYQVSFLTQAVVAQLRAWAQEEKACRLARKRAAAQDRLVALKHFTLQLVLTLHKRFVELPSPSSSSTVGRPMISSLSALLTGASASADRKAQDRLVDIFPFLGYREGVLYQGRAAMKVADEVAQGEVVLTLGHLLFHNRTGLLPSSSCSELKVLPWKTISSVQVIYRQQQQQQQVVAGELAQQQQEEQEEEGLCVEDFSGQRVVFLLSDGLAAPQIHRRLHDLAALILQEKLFAMVELPHPIPPPPPAISSGGASEDLTVSVEKTSGDSIPQRKQQEEQEEEQQQEEEQDLSAFLRQLEMEDLPSSSRVAATAPVVPPPAAASTGALAAKGSSEEEMDRLLREIIAPLSPSPAPPPPATVTSSTGVSSASTSEKKKSLAGNIQKFLQQHQHS